MSTVQGTDRVNVAPYHATAVGLSIFNLTIDGGG